MGFEAWRLAFRARRVYLEAVRLPSSGQEGSCDNICNTCGASRGCLIDPKNLDESTSTHSEKGF